MSILSTYAQASADYNLALEESRAAKKAWSDAAKGLVGKIFDTSEALAHLGEDAPRSLRESPITDAYGLRRLLDMYPHVAELCREVAG